MRNRAVLAFIVAAVTSSVVWAVSPWLTGQHEPWDAKFPFYISALVIAGATAGGLTPKPLWAHYLGSFTGQVGYQAFFLEIGPLLLLGAVFLLGYCLVFVTAAAAAGYIRLRFSTRPQRRLLA